MQFEAKLDDIKLKEKRRLKDEYADMIEWLVMLHRNIRYRPQDDYTKPIQTAFNQINEIESIIDYSENKLKSERDDIEKQLMEQKRNFVKELEEQQGEVTFFATQDIVRRAQEFKKKIKDIQAKLRYLTEELGRIHAQEADLEMMPGEYPVLDQLKQDIIPHQKLWDLRVDFDAKMQEWKHGPLKNLDPAEVESQHSKMRSLANQLKVTFEGKRNPAMPKPM